MKDVNTMTISVKNKACAWVVMLVAFTALFLQAIPSFTYAETIIDPNIRISQVLTGADYDSWVRYGNLRVATGNIGREITDTEWRGMTPAQRTAEIEVLERHKAIQQSRTRAPSSSECSWYSWPASPIQCILAPVLSGIAGIFLGLSGTVLQLSAYLFDLLVFKVIVAFGDTVKNLYLIDGIHRAWTALRDISNIVIIGMFTFIAISIIIGNHTFGEKKLIAKVLIVAVLINFSLLFAKIIIDSSNFVAWQIYKKMAPEGSGTASGGLIPAGTGGNISGKFLSIVGASTVLAGVSSAITVSSEAIAAGNAGALNSLAGAAKGVFYALFGSILLLTASGVLLYGSFLIATRAVLLVFLMLVSSLAFASYLIPKLSGGEYGWGAWWKSIINASIFGPLLMILLYASLLIITPAAAMRGTGSFAGIANNPAVLKNDSSWGIIAVFIFGIGMLYASFKVANSFANKIAGFGMAGAVPGFALGATSRLTGIGLRYGIGWPATSVAKKLQGRGWGVGKGIGGAVKRTVLRNTQRLADAPLDPFQSKYGKKFASNFGVPKFMQDLKTGQKGWVGTQKAAAAAAEERERKLGYSKDDKKTIVKKAIEEALQPIRQERVALEAAMEQHKKDLQNVEARRPNEEAGARKMQEQDRVIAAREIQKYKDEARNITNSKEVQKVKHESERRIAEAKIVNAQDADRASHEKALTDLIERQQKAVELLTSVEQDNNRGLTTAQQILENLDKEAAHAAAEVLKPELEGIVKARQSTEERIGMLKKKEEEISGETTKRIGEMTVESAQNTLNGWSNMYGAWKHPANQYVKGAIEEHHKNEELDKLAKAMAEHAKKHGVAAQPTATAATTGDAQGAAVAKADASHH